MASESAGGLRQCLVDLTKADTSGDYQKALQAANKLIRKFPKEHYAFKCKLIALVQLGIYDEALTLIKKTPPEQMGEISFEKAYVHYRLGDNREALRILSESTSKDSRVLELKAQVHYKLEEFKEAYEIFRQLLREHSDEFDETRKANLIAVQAQLSIDAIKDVDGDLDTFEQYYNAACLSIELKKYKQALGYLDKSFEVCQSTLQEEGLTAEEIDDELAIIVVQRAFVLQMLGRGDEARKIYDDIQQSSLSDKSVLCALSNNSLCCVKDANVAECRRRLKGASSVDQSKLSRTQRRILALNNALALLLANQREQCRRALDDCKTTYGSSRELALVETCLLTKFNENDKALAILKEDDDDQVLTRVHILLNAGKTDEAMQTLRRLSSSTATRPAVMKLMVATLVTSGQSAAALKELETAIAAAKDSEVKLALIEEAVELHMQAGNYAAAVAHLEKIASSRSNDVRVQCRLIRAYSHVDPSKAQALSAKMFPEPNTSDVNVDELEESDWILYGEKYRQKKEAKTDVEDTEIITRKLKNRKKKRKIRLPKNYDPNVAPDPERWLPRQERTAFKKKNKKNRDRDIGRGTQGSAAANATIEFTTASPNSPRALAGPVAEGPRQMRPKQAPKKKKKGGKF